MKLFDKTLLKKKVIHFFMLVIFILVWIVVSIQYIEKSFFYQKIQPILVDIWNLLNYTIGTLWDIKISFLSLISFTFVLFLWFTIWKFYKKWIYSIKRRNKSVSHWTITILANMGYYLIITICILISLKTIWIDLSSLTMIISALSVWIGFWLQTIVSNFISGIILMFEQSIKEWDFIEIWNDLKWTVVHINMRSTTIRTNNNINVIVPNQNFIENNIINWTFNDNLVRLHVPFGVEYWTTTEKVEEVILWALEESDIKYYKDDTKKPFIVMTGMWSSSVDFFLYVWVQWGETNTPLLSKWKFLKMIYKALNDNNISIPFPQRDLHIKSAVPLEVSMKK